MIIRDLMKRKTVKKVILTASIAAVLVAGSAGFAAAQGYFAQDSEAVPADTIPNPGEGTAFDGLKYGPPAMQVGEEDPELIAVAADNGQLGYVKREELRRAQGHPSMFHSPEEAVAWQKAHGGMTLNVTVYDLKGNAIGNFPVKRR